MHTKTSILFFLVIPLMLSGCNSNEKSSGSRTIGPEGGTVTLGGVSIVIPAGALSEEKTITIEENPSDYPEIPSSIERRGSVWAFLPHDLVFASPVTITIPFTGSATDDLKLFTAQYEGSWVATPNATVQGGSMQARVGHFSYFLPGTGGANDVLCSCVGDYGCVEDMYPASEAWARDGCYFLNSDCNGGSFSYDHCPSGYAGCCIVGPNLKGEIEKQYYVEVDPWSLGLAQANCEIHGGVWE